MRGTTRYTLTLHCIYICIDFFFLHNCWKKDTRKKRKDTYTGMQFSEICGPNREKMWPDLIKYWGFFFQFWSVAHSGNKQAGHPNMIQLNGGRRVYDAATLQSFQVCTTVSVSITNHNALFWWMYMLQTRTHMHSHTPSFQLDFLDHMPWLYQYIKQQTHQHKVWSCFNVGQLSVRLLLNCDTCVNVMWGRGEPGPELLYEMNVSVSSH